MADLYFFVYSYSKNKQLAFAKSSTLSGVSTIFWYLKVLNWECTMFTTRVSEYYSNLWYFNAHFNLTLMYFHLPSLSSVLFYLNSSWCIQLYWLGIICYKWFLWLDLSIFEKRGTKKINLELELNFHLSYTDKPRFTWFLCRSTVGGGNHFKQNMM